MKRKALVVGINHYQSLEDLFGCEKDSEEVERLLSTNGNGDPNFDVRPLRGTVTRSELRSAAQELFTGANDVALFYFAGHGYADIAGGYICGTDAADGHDGLALSDVLRFANESEAASRVIILDSCHSGAAGSSNPATKYAELREGVTVLTASTAEQYATEENDAGVFTALLVDALGGAAANVLGQITPGSVYAHIDQSLGTWDQRPVFKTNVNNFVSLRDVDAKVPATSLRQLTRLFPEPHQVLRLDPSYEPERAEGSQLPEPDPKNVRDFEILQACNRVGLVIPHDAPHMWHAAVHSKGCTLTPLGRHYHRLAKMRRI